MTGSSCFMSFEPCNFPSFPALFPYLQTEKSLLPGSKDRMNGNLKNKQTLFLLVTVSSSLFTIPIHPCHLIHFIFGTL